MAISTWIKLGRWVLAFDTNLGFFALHRFKNSEREKVLICRKGRQWILISYNRVLVAPNRRTPNRHATRRYQ